MPSELDDIDKKILSYLEKNSEKLINIKDICISIKISYPTVMKRVDVLEAKDLIEIEKKGGNRICKIKDG